MPSSGAPSLPNVVSQHVEEAAHLSHVRSRLVRAPHVRLHALRRHDQRLAAHLDGIAVAGEEGWAMCEEQLQARSAGAVFAFAVRAIEDGDAAHIDKMLSLAQALPAARLELGHALGWVSAHSLQGLIVRMLSSSGAVLRGLAIAACAAHRVDPGPALAAAMADAEEALRACALRAAGECGRRDLLEVCSDAARHEDAGHARFWAARSAALLGDLRRCCDALRELAVQPGPVRGAALQFLLKLLPPQDCGSLLRTIAAEPGGEREVIRGIGVVGDPGSVPWLIERMRDPASTRLTGESFAMLTGCDLSSPAFVKAPPEDAGDESDENASSGQSAEGPPGADEDDDLPEPDPDKALAWWRANQQRFVAGSRCFLGAPPGPAHCVGALRDGYQRQRIAAAEYLSLLQPGTPMFNAAAPGWRQQRWLAAMPS